MIVALLGHHNLCSQQADIFAVEISCTTNFQRLPLGKRNELHLPVVDFNLQRQARDVVRYLVEHSVGMTRISAHAGNADNTRSPYILIRDFGNGHVKARSRAFDNASYHTAFLLKGVARVKLKGELTDANNHAEE